MNTTKYTDQTKISDFSKDEDGGLLLMSEIYLFISRFCGLKMPNDEILTYVLKDCLEAFKIRFPFLKVGQIWNMIDLGVTNKFGQFFVLSPKLLIDWAEHYWGNGGSKHYNDWLDNYGPKMLDKAPEKEHEPMTPLEATRLSYASWKMLRGDADSIILHGGLVWEYLGKGEKLESKEKQREEVLKIFKNRLSKEVTYLK